jgi:hypothetical protein
MSDGDMAVESRGTPPVLPDGWYAIGRYTIRKHPCPHILTSGGCSGHSCGFFMCNVRPNDHCLACL